MAERLNWTELMIPDIHDTNPLLETSYILFWNRRSRKLVLQIPECVWASVLQTRLSSCPTTNVSQLPLFFPFFSPSFLPPSLPLFLPQDRIINHSFKLWIHSFIHSLLFHSSFCFCDSMPYDTITHVDVDIHTFHHFSEFSWRKIDTQICLKSFFV